jgi:hypothetical protein
LPSEPAECRRDQAGNDLFVACDPDFTGRRIGQELDALHALAQFIEHGCTASEQCAAVLSRLNALATAIEQTHTKRMLKFADRPRNGGLRCIEVPRCLAHAASLDDGHENMKIVQLHPAPDAIVHVHHSAHLKSDMF